MSPENEEYLWWWVYAVSFLAFWYLVSPEEALAVAGLVWGAFTYRQIKRLDKLAELAGRYPFWKRDLEESIERNHGRLTDLEWQMAETRKASEQTSE